VLFSFAAAVTHCSSNSCAVSKVYTACVTMASLLRQRKLSLTWAGLVWKKQRLPGFRLPQWPH